MSPVVKGYFVRVLKVGVDATDREINDALYGNSPPGFEYLEMMRLLVEEKTALKVYVNVADE